MPAKGYSGTPLLQKLGIKPAMKILMMHAPENYVQLLEIPIDGQFVKGKEVPDLIHLFAKNNAIFLAGMKKILPFCKENPSVIIWVSWYKKAAGIATDLTEDIIRNFALGNDLVDVKVCAVSDIWSGLKLVMPLAIR